MKTQYGVKRRKEHFSMRQVWRLYWPNKLIKKAFEFLKYAFKIMRLSKYQHQIKIKSPQGSGRKRECRSERCVLRNFSQTSWSDRILRLLCCHLRLISVSCHGAEMPTLKNDKFTLPCFLSTVLWMSLTGLPWTVKWWKVQLFTSPSR